MAGVPDCLPCVLLCCIVLYGIVAFMRIELNGKGMVKGMVLEWYGNGEGMVKEWYRNGKGTRMAANLPNNTAHADNTVQYNTHTIKYNSNQYKQCKSLHYKTKHYQ